MPTIRLPLLRAATATMALGATLALGGCATDNGGPVQVTRFHLAQPIAPGSFYVTASSPMGPGSPMAPDSLEQQTYTAPVAAELTRLGFTPAASAEQAELSVSVIVGSQSWPDPRPHGASVSFGIGGGGFVGRRSAVGGDIGTTVPIGGNNPRYIVGTRMQVQIKRRSEGTVIWEGQAQAQAPGQSSASSPGAAAARLAHALFLGFPGESGRRVMVKG